MGALPEAGSTDSIVDVPGVRVGQVEIGASPATPAGSTGVTAIVTAAGALGAIDVRGGAPGSRETDALSPLASNEQVHAVLLVGRSVFGLAAADGAVAELEARGIGLPLRNEELRLVVPIVPALVVFDFRHGDPAVRPDAAAGRRAVSAALDEAPARPRSGNAGAGTGASTGGLVSPKLKGGVGGASLVQRVGHRELLVGALVVVNSAGSLVDPATDLPWSSGGGFDRPAPSAEFGEISSTRGQTTLAVVATNARLSKAALGRVATMAHDGLARAIRPVHTSVDGDAVIALSVAAGPDARPIDAHPWPAAAASIVGSLAADAVTRAILDALRSARASGGISAWHSPPDSAHRG